MRIALVYRSFHTAGSLARQMVELARHLSQRHEVHVFSTPAATTKSLAPSCRFHDVPVSQLGDGRRFSARELVSFSRNAASLLSEERFDVVYACAPSTWVADVLYVPGIARDEARLQGIPRWRYAASAVRHPGDATRRILERKALTYPGLLRIHVAAPSVLDDVHRRYGVAFEDMLVVPPGVRLDEFAPPEDKRAARVAAGIDESDSLVLLFCGSDFERKGLDRAINALAELRTPAILLVVGGGREDPFRDLARDRGVDGRVHFFGARSDAWRFYQAADVLVLPTYADIWGLTPLEAMACGVPVIVSAATGSSEVVGGAGIVLPEPIDVVALRDAIEELADPARRHALGEAGMEAVKRHTWDERCALVEDDLLEVSMRRSGAGAGSSGGLARRRGFAGRFS